jgi:hypothetical protein
MSDNFTKYDFDFHLDKLMQTNGKTILQRKNNWTLTDKRENKYYPLFAFLKIFIIFFPAFIFLILTGCQNHESNSSYIKVIVQKPIKIYCDCSKGRPLGDIRVYNNLIQVGQTGADSIRVRSSPKWYADDSSNILGMIKSGSIIPAWGPMKAIPSHGLGYIIPLLDTKGNECRGYISESVVINIIENYFNNGKYFTGFPLPIDTLDYDK